MEPTTFLNTTVVGNYTYGGLTFGQQGGVLAACYVVCILLLLFWIQILFRFYENAQDSVICCGPQSFCWLGMQYAYLKIWTTCCCCCGPRTMRRLQRKVERIKEEIQKDMENMQQEEDSSSEELDSMEDLPVKDFKIV